ncbi:MAG: ABC transporter permease subunit [Gemmataceae bacterium]
MTPSAPHDARVRDLMGRIALVGFLLAVVAIASWVANGWSFPWIGARGTGPVLAVALFVLVASTAVLAYGPVLVYEMIRTARRGRLYLMRWLYVIGLFLLLLWVYSIADVEHRFGSPGPSYKKLTQLAESYFGAFAVTQFLILSMLTPAFVAGSIAEEKERKTLEFLLATDLNNREIVFGKLAARLGTLALFVIAGLPILSIMQFFGGIDPGILLTTFAATALTVLSLAAVSLFNSVVRRRARDAIVLTYLAAVGYLAFTGLTAFLKFLLGMYNLLIWGPIDLGELFDAFQAGNPIFGFVAVERAINTNGPLADVLLNELRSYAIFHSVLTAGCVAWSVLRLRAIALAQSGGGERKAASAKVGKRRRPVGLTPMIWKEVWVEGNVRVGRLGGFLVGLLIAGGFVPVVLIAFFLGSVGMPRVDTFFEFVGAVFSGIVDHRRQFGEQMNYWLRAMNAIIGTLMLLGVAARASGSVGVERDRDTLVSLMTTPLTTQQILWAKWLGSLASVRPLLWWLGPVWLITILAGGVNAAAVVLMAMAWMAPAAFFAAWGVYCSVTAATTLRSTTWGVMGALFFGGAHWICIGMCVYAPLAALAHTGDEMKWPAYIEAGLTPPAVFALVPFDELNRLDIGNDGLFPAFMVLGMVLWVTAAAIVGSLAHEQFARMTHRNAFARSDLRPEKKP